MKARYWPLPIIEVEVNDSVMTALVDTGCTTTLINSKLLKRYGRSGTVKAVDGRNIECKGARQVEIKVCGMHVKVRAILMNHIVDGIDVIIGMDVINELGGVTIKKAKVKFGDIQCAVAAHQLNVCKIEDKDFEANFDGDKWTVRWTWKGEPPVLQNKVQYYKNSLEGDKKLEFEKEVERWISDGILLPWKGERKGVLPLMAVFQATKGKVRPVFDFRELNRFVACHTGSDIIDVCDEKIRKWRQLVGGTAIVDLKSAYLQLHVAKELWQYQLVCYKGKTYCLTRLGFGLNVAPKIMAAILKTVLKKGSRTKEATDSYIDDIMVDVTKISTQEVVEHLKGFGLAAKSPESLDGGAALGLKLMKNKMGALMFRRGNEIPEMGGEISRRELFSICGKLLGHYPIAGWLRLACSYVKRRANGVDWEEKVDCRTMKVMQEVLAEVKKEDPVNGAWHIPEVSTGVVWCDASNVATGVVVEIGGVVAEDATWLRKSDDFNHINIAELDAVLKGVNLAIKWRLTNIEIRTDSATVLSWVNSTVEESGRIRTKGAGEVIIKRRLGMLRELMSELKLQIKAVFVPSERNKADALTRIKKQWLIEKEEAPICCLGIGEIKELHDMHHMGVERTLYLVRQVDPNVKREEIQMIVKNCVRCQSIDPAPNIHNPGEIGVLTNWTRLAIDIAHYRGGAYLSIIDCGPSRLAIWKELRVEAASAVATELEKVMLERGLVREVIMDNGTVFRSEIFQTMLKKWKIKSYYRAAYRPGGNGIVERHHRTVKAIAERGRISPEEATFWYNMSPKVGQRDDTVPHRAIFNYEWRHPRDMSPEINDQGPARIQIGEEVWVKPPNARCTTQWGRGVITGVQSPNNLSVNGMPRHVLDLRRVVHLGDEDGGTEPGSDEDEPVPMQRPQRERNAPIWTRDYEM